MIVTFPRVYVIIPAICKMLAATLTLDLRVPSICAKNLESIALCRWRSGHSSSAAISLIFPWHSCRRLQAASCVDCIAKVIAKRYSACAWMVFNPSSTPDHLLLHGRFDER